MASGLLGSKTGDVLTWVTIVLACLFLLVSFVMAKYYRPAPSEPASPAPVTQPQPSLAGQAEMPEQAEAPQTAPNSVPQ
jgi:preprotein translocase subunit SecG